MANRHYWKCRIRRTAIRIMKKTKKRQPLLPCWFLLWHKSWLDWAFLDISVRVHFSICCRYSGGYIRIDIGGNIVCVLLLNATCAVAIATIYIHTHTICTFFPIQHRKWKSRKIKEESNTCRMPNQQFLIQSCFLGFFCNLLIFYRWNMLVGAKLCQAEKEKRTK